MTKDQVIQRMMGFGKLWEKGEHSRTYFDSKIILDMMGYKISLYNSGNISSASLNGKHISNCEARRVISCITQSWVDNHTGKLHQTYQHLEVTPFLKKLVEERLED